MNDATKDDRLAVKAATAARMMSIGMTRLYQLLNSGELVSYKDGRSRMITVASIRDRVARLAEPHAPDQAMESRGSSEAA